MSNSAPSAESSARVASRRSVSMTSCGVPYARASSLAATPPKVRSVNRGSSRFAVQVVLGDVAPHEIGHEIPDARAARQLLAHERCRSVERGKIQDAQLPALI